MCGLRHFRNYCFDFIRIYNCISLVPNRLLFSDFQFGKYNKYHNYTNVHFFQGIFMDLMPSAMTPVTNVLLVRIVHVQKKFQRWQKLLILSSDDFLFYFFFFFFFFF